MERGEACTTEDGATDKAVTRDDKKEDQLE